jgi:DNA-binding XRE family transcriptional regulator
MFQKDVAKELGVNQWTFIGWELDRKAPAPIYYPKLISFIGYNPLPEPTSVAGRMKYHRLSLGLTQEQAAREVGIDESTLWRHENGLQSPTTLVREKIESWLNTTT